jgi:hypothetical protein
MSWLQGAVFAILAIGEAVVVAVLAENIDVTSSAGVIALMGTGGIFAGLAALTIMHLGDENE